jgi:hypothetical protein
MYKIQELIATIDWRLVATIGVPTVVVVGGWFLVHWLNARRDLAARKREARLKALELAYMRIATSSNRPFTDKSMDDIEMFVSEIQLYGTPRQIELMSTMVENFKGKDPVSYDDILADLRDTIRSELKLEPVTGPVWWFRFGRSPKTETANTPPNADGQPSGGAPVG